MITLNEQTVIPGSGEPSSGRALLDRLGRVTRLRGALWPHARSRSLRGAMRIEGQTTYEELSALHDAARRVRSEQAIVEIGSYRGRSTVALALGAMAGACRRVYAVDPHVDFIGPCGGQYGPADQQALYANVARFKVGHVVFAVALPGSSAAAGWPGPRVGLLWIDGDHRYEAVRADLAAWYPHLAAECVIGFHDADFEDVASVIDETLARGEFREVRAVGRLKLLARSVEQDCREC